MHCDVLIVGAGFAGLVMAERLTNVLGKRCVVVDKRKHLGGNAHDYYNDAGVLVHKYGAHLFHTNSKRIFEYLSRFTEWIPATYNASSYTAGRLWSFPVNLKTFEQFIGRESTTEEMEAFLSKVRVQYAGGPKNSEEIILSRVGPELYELFYRGYTAKQWGRQPSELDSSVCARVPIRTTRDDRYFNDVYQCMPAQGYTALFNRMVGQTPGLTVLLDTDYRSLLSCCEYKHLVYTGPIDEFFDCAHGPLPYRTLRFEHESYSPAQMLAHSDCGIKGFWQPTIQVAYPNSEKYTRAIEIKHATGQICSNTTVVREYPDNYVPGKEPYYPMPTADAAARYIKYKKMADKLPGVTFVGRLARYQYLNMDQVVGSSLAAFDSLRGRLC